LYKLARLYVQIGDLDKAASCYELNLNQRNMEETPETSEALMFMAKHALS